MLTGWLIFAALLAPTQGAPQVSATPTYRVKGHPGADLTLNCGDGKKAGVVQLWHTPLGDLQTSDSSTEMDSVFKLQDGSLVVPNASVLHSGLYYCLLQHAEGTTLWPYELHISQKNQENLQNQEHGQQSSRDAFRFRRDVGSEGRQAASDGQFAAAVAASVLLTFVVGFSAGALSRTHVLRCLGAITIKLRSLRQRPQQTDTAGAASEVTTATLQPRYHGHTSGVDQVTVSTTTSPPPVKPQRSFRNKQDEEQETTVYLQGCDHKEEQEEPELERAITDMHLLGEDGGSQSEMKKERRQGKESEQDGGEKRGNEEAGSNKEKDGDDREEEREEDGEKDETGSRKRKNGTTEEACVQALPPLGRHSRIIRLYQYDEDGQRYCHLPDPSPDELAPAPRLKQRSVSLTRLSAIMATAAGPLDTTGGGAHFHLEI